MANILQKLKSTALIAGGKPQGLMLPGASRTKTALGFFVGRGERAVGSFMFGAAKGYLGARNHIGGAPSDLVLGGTATLLAGLLEVWSKGRSALAPHLLGLVGDPGLSSYFNAVGAAWGGKKAGRRTFVLDKGSPEPKSLPQGMHEVIGASLPSGKGAFLSGDEVRDRLKPRR